MHGETMKAIVTLLDYKCFVSAKKVLPEDGEISAEIRRRVLIIIHIFYCISTFCWYIKVVVTVRITHRMDSCTGK